MYLTLSLLLVVAALAIANARIASLEAELTASQKAYDIAAAAKASAEKSQKSALGKAKKAEKALANANKEHAQREQAVAERLRTISAAKGMCFTLFSISSSVALLYLLILSFPFLSFVVQYLPGSLRRPCNRMMTL
jgi:uncharacterized membrane protein YdbT with pleckstrin-like domain